MPTACVTEQQKLWKSRDSWQMVHNFRCKYWVAYIRKETLLKTFGLKAR